MITTDNLKPTYAVDAQFMIDVCSISAELDGVTKSFIAVEAANDEDILTDELYKDAVFGIRVSFCGLADRLRELVSETHSFTCIKVKEVYK